LNEKIVSAGSPLASKGTKGIVVEFRKPYGCCHTSDVIRVEWENKGKTWIKFKDIIQN
jgi:hypothetical protein